jgi:DNA adenine methylase
MDCPSDSTSEPLRPLLKWAGGKRWLRPMLRALYDGHQQRRLVEPFCGALGVALGLRPDAALLNDINPHVINFHTQVQRGLRTRLAMRNDKALYYDHREAFNALIARQGDATKRAAALFYFLNRTGFNGLCRFNRAGSFNVPFGKYPKIRYCRDFTDHQPVLEGWQFSSMDFESLVLRTDDFVYADPPYDVEFRQYSPQGFSIDDQARLANWLTRHDGPVVASNQHTPAMRELYGDLGFALKKVAGPRRISRTGDRTPAMEMLAFRSLGQKEINAAMRAL